MDLKEKISIDTPDYTSCINRFRTITAPKYSSTAFPNTGVEFEYLMIRLFELSGLQVCYPTSNKTEQIDGFVYLNQIPFMVESKKYSTKIDIEPIAKLMARMQTRPSFTMGLIISLSGVTTASLEYMKYLQPKNIIIFQGSEIEEAIKNANNANLLFRGLLEKKFQALVEKALFQYHLSAFLEDIK